MIGCGERHMHAVGASLQWASEVRLISRLPVASSRHWPHDLFGPRPARGRKASPRPPPACTATRYPALPPSPPPHAWCAQAPPASQVSAWSACDPAPPPACPPPGRRASPPSPCPPSPSPSHAPRPPAAAPCRPQAAPPRAPAGRTARPGHHRPGHHRPADPHRAAPCRHPCRRRRPGPPQARPCRRRRARGQTSRPPARPAALQQRDLDLRAAAAAAAAAAERLWVVVVCGGARRHGCPRPKAGGSTAATAAVGRGAAPHGTRLRCSQGSAGAVWGGDVCVGW
jgi:hypothetical protein